ncbi:MAG TPA: methionyl-tRNA formyltransferase [Steroidobacteraceae bacterium]|nr:methionyl-tRNA formyltransferase [Steroidobacteraceae bacterium]
MQPGSLTVGFAGTPSFALPALEALARSHHRIAAVLTRPDRPAGRGQALVASPIKRRALELGVAVLQPASLTMPAALEALRALELDALIVVAYGLILPREALASPRLGCLNIHASLLPRWRGAAPIERAILAGDAQTGVSIMRMQEGLDTGPILAQRVVAIAPLESAGELHERLARLGAELMMETLEAVGRGTARETPQPEAGVTYAAKIEKREALIDWSEDASSILRRIRAFNPRPVAETRLAGVQLRIWEAAPAAPSGSIAAPGTVLAASGEGIEVACGRGTLRLERLQLAGRKPLGAREFLNAQSLAHARLGAT